MSPGFWTPSCRADLRQVAPCFRAPVPENSLLLNGLTDSGQGCAVVKVKCDLEYNDYSTEFGF